MNKENGNNAVVDLRSDTVTKPTPEMRRAMAEAEVGDDVYGEDPTVHRLEARAAEILGREAGLFVPSGSMGNRSYARAHPAGAGDHLRGAVAHLQLRNGVDVALAGCLARPVRGDGRRARLEQVKQAIRPKVFYSAQTALVSARIRTTLRAGRFLPSRPGRWICDGAHDAGPPVHLDGARVFNAAVALGTTFASSRRSSTR